MSECDSWPTIQKHGLLSVTALLDLFEYSGPKRNSIESEWRPSKVAIKHPVHGTVVIRDQKPMPPDALQECLKPGLEPSDWYKLLNGKSFFWAGTARLERMLTAKAYMNERHWVIKVDANDLLDRYLEKIELTPFNTGFAFDGRTRGVETFKRLADWPRAFEVAEVAVDYAVPDIADLTVSVVEWMGAWESGERVCKRIRNIWPY